MSNEDTNRRCREMSDITRFVREASGDLAPRVREAGRAIGAALAAYNVDAGHDLLWVSAKAWAAYYDIMLEGFEEVNLALGLQPDAVS